MDGRERGGPSDIYDISHFEWFYNKMCTMVRLLMVWKAENLTHYFYGTKLVWAELVDQSRIVTLLPR